MDHNYRFKLSYLMPNFWFYKLRDMGNSTKQSSTITSQSTKNKQFSSTPTSSKPKQPHQYYNPRKSYHFTRINTSSPNNQQVLNTTNFHDQPRKSTKPRAKRRASRTSSPLQLGFHDIITDVDNNSIARKDDKLGGGYDDSFSKLVLPPIVTKTSTKFNDFLSDDAKNNNNKETKPRRRKVTNKDKQQNVKGESGFTTVNYVNCQMDNLTSESMTLDPSNDSHYKYDRSESKSVIGSLKVKIRKENNALKEVKSSPSGSRRLRLKINSPRIRSRKSVSSVAATTSGRRSLSGSFAIVKSSFNPLRDFRESMVEMIVHNNMRSSKDMEDLLACYLSLNSDEYHHLIIKAFKQIWFDFSDNQLRKM